MMLSWHWNDSGSLIMTPIESRYINFLCMLVVKSSLFQQGRSVTSFFFFVASHAQANPCFFWKGSNQVELLVTTYRSLSTI
jgi:hypothetical protein